MEELSGSKILYYLEKKFDLLAKQSQDESTGTKFTSFATTLVIRF